MHAGKIRRMRHTDHDLAHDRRGPRERPGEGAVIWRGRARTAGSSRGPSSRCRATSSCLAVGLRPFDELLRALGVEMKYVSGLGGFVPLHDENLETSKRGVYVAGDITGIEEANTAMDEGRLVGVAVAEKLGRLDRRRPKS